MEINWARLGISIGILLSMFVIRLFPNPEMPPEFINLAITIKGGFAFLILALAFTRR